MTKINIEKLEVYAYHGVYDFEKDKGQHFYFDAEIVLKPTEIYDDINNTVNYGELCSLIKDTASNKKYNLIETLAETCADAILKKYKLVDRVTITVHKPEAPIKAMFGDVSVTIEKAR